MQEFLGPAVCFIEFFQYSPMAYQCIGSIYIKTINYLNDENSRPRRYLAASQSALRFRANHCVLSAICKQLEDDPEYPCTQDQVLSAVAY